MNTCSNLTKGSSVTFESVGEILCCSHSNETLSAVLWRSTIYFFTIRENCVLEKFWPYLGAQWLKLNSEMEKNKYMQRRQAVRRKNIRKIWSLDTQKKFYLQFWENLLCIVNVGVHRFMWFLIRSLWNPVEQELKTLCTSLYLLGSLTKNERDGFENVN